MLEAQRPKLFVFCQKVWRCSGGEAPFMNLNNLVAYTESELYS